MAGCGGSPTNLSVAPQVIALHHHTETFICTEHRQSFTVPDGVTQVRVIAAGASGGGLWYLNAAEGLGSLNTPAAAAGGLVKATLPVAPGEKLALFVGCSGAGRYGSQGGFNGGGNGGAYAEGGGGASDVREGGDGLNNRVVVAGGGGGFGANGPCGGSYCCPHGADCTAPGGDGGNMVAASGGRGCDGNGDGSGGGGGTQSAGGDGGSSPGSDGTTDGGKGHAAKGGTGGEAGSGGGGGGGGGGYYGGGGGGGGLGFCGGGGGGGGSSYIETSARRVKMVQGGGCSVASCIGVNGVIAISWKSLR